jgi:hypothetical protein
MQTSLVATELIRIVSPLVAWDYFFSRSTTTEKGNRLIAGRTISDLAFFCAIVLAVYISFPANRITSDDGYRI